MVDAIGVLLGKLRTGSTFLSEDADGAFQTMGNVSGGFIFRDHPGVVRDVSRMGRSELVSLPGFIPVNASSEIAMCAQSCGRGTDVLIAEARRAALCAANDNATFTARADAVILVKRVCGSRRPPEYDALRTGVLSGEQLLQVAESLNLLLRVALLCIEMALFSDRRSSSPIDEHKIHFNEQLLLLVRTSVLRVWSAPSCEGQVALQ